MTDKGDILREIDAIKINYQSGEYKKFANFDIVINNIEKIMEYSDNNDLWEHIAYGVNESLIYICMYILVVACIEHKATENLTNCEKFYNFVEEWFRENYEKYEAKRDPCMSMISKCAEEISDSLKNE